MKKTILILASMLSVIAYEANSQSNILNLPEFNSGKAIWMVKVGLDFNTAVGEWKDTQIDSWEKTHKNLPLDASFPSRTSFNVAAGFNKSFGSHPLYWGMELGVGTRGYNANAHWSKSTVSSTFGDVIAHTIKQNIGLTAYNIDFKPFTLGYKYIFLERMALDVHASAFVSFDFAGQQKIYNYDYQLSANVPREKEDENKIKISDLDKYQRIDAGINIGIGYWFGHFNLDFSWQRGFINMFDVDDSIQRQSLQLKLGYAF